VYFPATRKCAKETGLPGIARKTDNRVKLYSRPGSDLTKRFYLISGSDGPIRPYIGRAAFAPSSKILRE
jgi:hypothetical protein